MDTVNTELIRGHVDTIILRSLEEQDRYGYEILDIISSLSEGRYEIKQPTLYSCLKRLEKQGFISSYFGDESNGGRRRYYKLSDKGRETLERDQKEWEFSRSIIDKLLSDKQIDLGTAEAPFNPSELRPLTKRVRVYDDGEINREEKIVSEPPKTPDLTPILSAETPAPKAQTVIIARDEPKEPSPSDPKRTEQVIAASKLLRIGEFADSPATILTREISSEAPREKTVEKPLPPVSEIFAEPPKTENLNYREALRAIFDSENKSAIPITAEQPYLRIDTDAQIENTAKTRHFNDLKQSLQEEGYRLKTYNKANSSDFYYMNYIYSNRLLRDTSIFVYLALVIELLIMIVATTAGKNAVFGSPYTYLIIAAVGTAIPLSAVFIWMGNPLKRIKARFNFRGALVASVIIFLIISAIALLVSLVARTSLKVDFGKGTAYVPYILAANLPLSVVIYNFLYKTQNYRLRK